MKEKEKVVRPGGLELPTFWFVAKNRAFLSASKSTAIIENAELTSRCVPVRTGMCLNEWESAPKV